MAPPRNALLPRKTHEMSFRDPESKTFTQPPRVSTPDRRTHALALPASESKIGAQAAFDIKQLTVARASSCASDRPTSDVRSLSIVSTTRTRCALRRKPVGIVDRRTQLVERGNDCAVRRRHWRRRGRADGRRRGGQGGGRRRHGGRRPAAVAVAVAVAVRVVVVSRERRQDLRRSSERHNRAGHRADARRVEASVTGGFARHPHKRARSEPARQRTLKTRQRLLLLASALARRSRCSRRAMSWAARRSSRRAAA